MAASALKAPLSNRLTVVNTLSLATGPQVEIVQLRLALSVVHNKIKPCKVNPIASALFPLVEITIYFIHDIFRSLSVKQIVVLQQEKIRIVSF